MKETKMIFIQRTEVMQSALPHTTTLPMKQEFKTLWEREKSAIIEALGETQCCMSKAAEMLGVSRSGLYVKIREHSLSCWLPRSTK